MELLSRPLTYFMACADAGSLGAAAVQMSITKPAMSIAIKHLETEMKCDLFERNAKGISLTPAGQKLHEDLSVVLGRLGRATRNLDASVGSKVFRIGCVPQFMSNYLLRFNERHSKKLPGFQIYGGFSYVIHENVLRGNFDFGIISWTHKPEALESVKIKPEPLAVVGLKSKFPEVARAKKLKDLEHCPMIWLPKIQKDPNDYFDSNRPGYVVPHYYGFKHLILNGYGIGEVQLDFFTPQEIKRLAMAKFPAPRDGVDVYLVYRADAPESVMRVIDFVAKGLKKEIRST